MENLGKTPHLLLNTPKGQRYFPLVGKNYWTIGRGKDNDFTISDHCISRNHAILQSTETGEFLLIDLGSRNGTFVNSRRVSIPVTLHNGDEVTFGKTEVKFYCPISDRQTDDDMITEPLDRDTIVLHERRLTSVMVVDMRNFTTLTRQLDEEVLSSLIGNWFREAGEIIRYSGSWVDKYIGDAVMAIWFHGENEVTKADIMQIFQAVSDLNTMTKKLSQQYPVPFELNIGAGINTGYSMVGNTGSGDHPDYTAIGDTVNAAFRLESATKELGLDVAVGEQTYKCLTDLTQAQNLFYQYTVSLKGYETPTITYGINFKDLQQFLQANIIQS
ncbi:adenylate/guanylate cyclase domain-containing protein [Crocosphaera sp. UHCC 0190]|uniref:adenylate/guanylate cyclase domain-containing protein n=1 Tax=Crocosphaera sp. UHCC 0190 TaxID=3110246 RepID=UPI002B20D97A|nr:adenylate/guanylate cyclase domain-containing protein [Crocosphaera sp. UHCC 0190]MEA5508630.1 adenylate/guanylate cyclase domain-containing protein [Crocosphaera sp. UHCC 0190]